MSVIDAVKDMIKHIDNAGLLKKYLTLVHLIKNTKMVTAATSNKNILAKNILTGEITSHETMMGCVRSLNVNKKWLCGH